MILLNIDLPKNCDNCPFKEYGVCKFTNYVVVNLSTRPENCPIIPMRLEDVNEPEINKDEIINNIMQSSKKPSEKIAELEKIGLSFDEAMTKVTNQVIDNDTGNIHTVIHDLMDCWDDNNIKSNNNTKSNNNDLLF